MSDLNVSFEQGGLDAIAKGCTILVAPPDRLFLDLDSEAAVRQFDKVLPEWNRHDVNGGLRLEVVERYYSESGPPNQHVILKVHPSERRDGTLTFEEQIALQAILGSDPTKEMLTMLRYWQGVEKPIRLFKPADAVPVTDEPWPNPVLMTPWDDL